jgi:hypothetical protein
MSDNPYLHKGDEWYLTPHIEIAPNPKDMEIERLRARVADLERALKYADCGCDEGFCAAQHCPRAFKLALEAKP